MGRVTPEWENPILIYRGSKYKIAPKIIELFPKHKIYIDCFGGGGGMLIRKPLSEVEVYNDIDKTIVDLMRVLRDKHQSKELIRKLLLTPYSREEFYRSDDYREEQDLIEKARKIYIRSYMGFGSLGLLEKKNIGFKGQIIAANESLYVWCSLPKRLTYIAKRLSCVLIENRCAFEIIKEHNNNKDVLLYCDPPYVMATRSNGYDGRDKYINEMDDKDHENLINLLKQSKSNVILSGYNSELYNDLLKGWYKHEFIHTRMAGRGSRYTTECIWTNCTGNKYNQTALF
jgi:DNA adenine methylase